MNESQPNKRSDSRQYVQCPTQFYMDSDVVDARTLDFSEGGIRLQVLKPIRVVMRINMGGREEDRVATLVWARKNAAGALEYGLQYPDESALTESGMATPEVLSPTEKAARDNELTALEHMYPPPNSFFWWW
jgi:hypothetical protein